MPIKRVQFPDGSIKRVEVPEGATNEQIIAFVASQHGKAATKKPEGNRALQLAGRAVAQGVAGTLDMIGEGVRKLPTMGLFDLAMKNTPSLRSATQATLTGRGVTQPRTAGERVAVDVGEAATGTALTLGAGTAGNVRFLKANPVLQGAGAVTGATAAGVARESGASPLVQSVAALAGGMAPAGARYAGPAAVRRVFRGGEDGRKRLVETTNDFRAVGTTPTVGQATGNRLWQGVESTLGKLPGSAGVIARKAETQGREIGRGVRATADRLAPNANSETAGRAITRGINSPDDPQSFMQRTGRTQEALYGELDARITPNARVGVESTASALSDLNADIPGAPELSKQFRNSRINSLGRALEADTHGKSGVLSRPDVREWMEEMRAGLKSEADYIAEQNARRQAEVEARNAQRRAEVMARNEARRNAAIAENERYRSVLLEERPLPPDDPLPVDEVATIDPVPTPAQIDEQIMGRVAAMADGRLPYEAVQKTRTLVGREIQDAGIGADVPRSKWNPLYGALSDDMRGAADDAGLEARAAWERANRYTRAKSGRQDAISHVVDRDGGPEAIFNAALSGTKEGATTLRALMRSLPEGSQRQVAAAVLNRMGRAGGSAVDEFSNETFLTNWRNMSPQARAALFDRFGPEFRAQVDAITRTATRLREGSNVFKNGPGTAAAQSQNLGMTALGTTAVGAMFGHPVPLLATIGGMGLNYGLARTMTSPRFVDFLGQRTPVPYGTAAPMGTLGQMMLDAEDRKNQGR